MTAGLCLLGLWKLFGSVLDIVWLLFLLIVCMTSVVKLFLCLKPADRRPKLSNLPSSNPSLPSQGKEAVVKAPLVAEDIPC